MRDKSRGKVLPFKRPPRTSGIVFERIEIEEGLPEHAYFHFVEKPYTYRFWLARDESLVEGYREGFVYDDPYEPSEAEEKQIEQKLEELAQKAAPIARDQFRLWDGLTTTERIRLLISWGEDGLERAEKTLQELVVTERPRDYTEEIMHICRDIEAFEQYLTGLSTTLTFAT